MKTYKQFSLQIFYLFIVLFVKCKSCSAGKMAQIAWVQKNGLPFAEHKFIIPVIRIPWAGFFSAAREVNPEKEIFQKEGSKKLFCSLLVMEENDVQDNENFPAPSAVNFEELYEKYATDVLRVAYYYLGDRQRAEDVAQDVFVKLLVTRPELIPGKEKSWLLKVALNKCRDLWRSSWIRKVILGHPSFELFPADDEIGRAADSISLAQAVGKLPAEFKEVVLLHYYQGYSVNEISEIIDVAEGTVSSRLSRARTRMLKELKGE